MGKNRSNWHLAVTHAARRSSEGKPAMSMRFSRLRREAGACGRSSEVCVEKRYTGGRVWEGPRPAAVARASSLARCQSVGVKAISEKKHFQRRTYYEVCNIMC